MVPRRRSNQEQVTKSSHEEPALETPKQVANPTVFPYRQQEQNRETAEVCDAAPDRPPCASRGTLRRMTSPSAGQRKNGLASDAEDASHPEKEIAARQTSWPRATLFSIPSRSFHDNPVLRDRPGSLAMGRESYTEETAAGLILPVASGSNPAARGFSDSSHCCESLTL